MIRLTNIIREGICPREPGEPDEVYLQRYKTVNPFYNGIAIVQDYCETLGQIDITGNIKFIIPF